MVKSEKLLHIEKEKGIYMSTERVNDLVRDLMLNNYLGASEAFSDIMNDKVSTALENISQGISDGVFNDEVCEECDAEEVEEARKANKDYDGDGKVETGSQEYLGSRDKAIKKAMAARKEEAEELDELKSDTLRSYRQKAQDDANEIARLNQRNRGPLQGRDRRDMAKRMAGKIAATSRLDARSKIKAGDKDPDLKRLAKDG